MTCTVQQHLVVLEAEGDGTHDTLTNTYTPTNQVIRINESIEIKQSWEGHSGRTQCKH